MPMQRPHGRPFNEAEARTFVLALFERDLDNRPRLVGPLSMELGVSFGLHETERLLLKMCAEGVLQRVEVDDQRHLAFKLKR